MTVMGVLAVDVGTDLIPAMGLGIEPPEPGIMERPPRRRDQKLLSLPFILRSYFVHGTLLALSCYATYYYIGWLLGSWRPGDNLFAMPSSPKSLDLTGASHAYLQTLTAYFFPTVTTQICQRSLQALFEKFAVLGAVSSTCPTQRSHCAHRQLATAPLPGTREH